MNYQGNIFTQLDYSHFNPGLENGPDFRRQSRRIRKLVRPHKRFLGQKCYSKVLPSIYIIKISLDTSGSPKSLKLARFTKRV